MFWAKRLKEANGDADGTWVLSYGDLMSLLLVVFVMLAAMSELRSGERFSRVGDGVRAAFGFADLPEASQATAATGHPPTLLEKLERSGFQRQSQVQLIGPDDEVLAPCDVIVGKETVTLRIAGHASFGSHSAVLDTVAARAVRRLAAYLVDGTNRIEIRGHGDAEPPPADVPFRDDMDLSYARARAVLDTLAGSGIGRERMFITAWADRDPLDALEARSEDTPAGAERRIEIVVHAVAAAGTSR